MIYAVKLPLQTNWTLNFAADDVVLGRHVMLFGRDREAVLRHGLSRREAKSVLKLLPPALRTKCRGLSKTMIQPLPVHIHMDEACVINFYAKTKGEETVFYSGEVRLIDGQAQDNGNAYHLVDPALLTEVQKFVAQDGEVWALSTRQPHAVVSTGGASREVVQAFFDVPIEAVVREFRHVL